jgi:hypothetical protein
MIGYFALNVKQSELPGEMSRATSHNHVHWLTRFRSGLGQEVSLDRLRHGRVIEIRLSVFVLGGPENLVHNIPGVALAQLQLQSAANEIDEILGDARFKLDLILVGNAAKNLAELIV